jgi:hypothetical protein
MTDSSIWVELLKILGPGLLTGAVTLLIVWLARRKDAATAGKTEAEAAKTYNDIDIDESEDYREWVKIFLERMKCVEEDLKQARKEMEVYRIAAVEAERKAHLIETDLTEKIRNLESENRRLSRVIEKQAGDILKLQNGGS